MQKIDELAKELRDVQGGVNEVLRDTLGDYKQREDARERRDKRQSITVWFLIAALIGCFIYWNWSFKSFLEQYDFTSEIITIEGDQEAVTDGGGNASNSVDIK